MRTTYTPLLRTIGLVTPQVGANKNRLQPVTATADIGDTTFRGDGGVVTRGIGERKQQRQGVTATPICCYTPFQAHNIPLTRALSVAQRHVRAHLPRTLFAYAARLAPVSFMTSLSSCNHPLFHLSNVLYGSAPRACDKRKRHRRGKRSCL